VRCRALRAARLAAFALVAFSALAFIGLGLGPRTGRYRTLTVLSGSMSPAFEAGDLLVITPEPIHRLGVGDVITYAIPIGDHHVETHRIVHFHWRAGQPIARTKGDANARADPWTAQLQGPTAWRTAFSVPKVGLLIVWLRRPLVHGALQLVAPTLLALFGLISIWWQVGLPRRRHSGHVSGA